MTHRRRAPATAQILPGVLLLVAGVLIAVGAPGIWAMTHQDPALQAINSGVALRLAQESNGSSTVVPGQVGQSTTTRSPVPQPATARTTPTGAPGRSAPPGSDVSRGLSGVRTTVPTAPNVRPTSTVAPRNLDVPRIGSPARLLIPAIGVDAPVEAVGVDDRGEMAIPAQVDQIGWYRFGSAPGASTGSVVMSGHVDSAQQGLGAFHDLGGLRAGDAIVVADAAGRQLRYRVIGREAFDKATVPLADLFSRRGAARLTLITCGGGFNPAELSYLDNIVVTAVPA